MNNRKRSAGWFFALEKSTMIYSNTEQSTNWRDQLYSYGSNSYTLCMKKRSSGFFNAILLSHGLSGVRRSPATWERGHLSIRNFGGYSAAKSPTLADRPVQVQLLDLAPSTNSNRLN